MASQVASSVLTASAAEQITIFEQIEWPKPFLRELLFPRDTIFRSTGIQIDYKRASRRLAPFVGKFQYGRTLLDADSVAQLIQLPAFAPTRVLRADDFLPGTTGCGFVTPGGTDFATQSIARNWEEMELSLTTREEWQIAQLLTTGVITIVGDAVGSPNEPPGKLVLRYEINEPSGELWNTSGDLVAWLHAASRALAAKCGTRPDTLILGSAAASAFMANPAVMRERELLANIQNTAPELEANDVMFLGRFASLNCYEYDGIYLESEKGDESKFTDVVKDMIPAESAILASAAMAGSMVFGGIAVTEERQIVVHAARRVPTSWPDRDNGLWKQRISSRFAPAPADSGSWQTYTNVLAGSTSSEPLAQARAKKS